MRAQIVLLATQGATNVEIASRLGIVVNTASTWRKRFVAGGLAGLRDRERSGRPKTFGTAVVAEVTAIACELPAKRNLPLGRCSSSEIAAEVIATGITDEISASTVWRILADAVIRPWRYRSWILPRDPRFAEKAGVVLDL